jgi:UDP-N-acetylglucosamine transferase subunit ALG13
MILVTLGTQDKPFTRLLEAIEKQINKGVIKDKVVVQAGCTSFKSSNMEIFDLIPIDEFENLIASCDILITHGGVGSIITGLKHNKKVIAAARLKEYGEHTNNHQIQIIDNFVENKYILSLNDFDNLDKVLKNIKKFKPKPFISNTNNMLQLVESKINLYLK